MKKTISRSVFYTVTGLLTAVAVMLLIFVILLKKDVVSYENTTSLIGTYEASGGLPDAAQYLVFEQHEKGLICIWYQQGEFQYSGYVTELKKGIYQIHLKNRNQELFVFADRKEHVNLVEKDFAGSFDKIANHSIYMGKPVPDTD